MSGAVGVGLEAVHKHFSTDAGVVRAVNGITLHVEAGESLAITGPSGCGKSTLLSLIGGLEAPGEGRVTVGGEVISELSGEERARFRRQQIGFVFQSHNLQPFLTAVENVSLALALAACREGYARSVDLLTGLGLGTALEKYPDQLSGGERQRVAVARALVHRPRLILADEPTGSLDTGNSVAVIDLLMQARAEAGATLVVITHDLGVAGRLGRRLRLRDGEVEDDSGRRMPSRRGTLRV